MKKLLAVMCMVVSFSSVAATKEELKIAKDLGMCTAAEQHMDRNDKRNLESIVQAKSIMGKDQYASYWFGIGLVAGLEYVGENNMIVQIYKECKAKYNM